MQMDGTLLDVTCCVHLHTLLHVVGSCCAKFETGQTFSNVQTDATTPNNVGSCWPTILSPFAQGFSDNFPLTIQSFPVIANSGM